MIPYRIEKKQRMAVSQKKNQAITTKEAKCRKKKHPQILMFFINNRYSPFTSHSSRFPFNTKAAINATAARKNFIGFNINANNKRGHEKASGLGKQKIYIQLNSSANKKRYTPGHGTTSSYIHRMRKPQKNCLHHPAKIPRHQNLLA